MISNLSLLQFDVDWQFVLMQDAKNDLVVLTDEFILLIDSLVF